MIVRCAQGRRRDRHIDGRAQQHRADNADGEIAGWIPGLFGGGRNRVEAVEREEDQRRRRQHAAFGAVRTDMGEKAEGQERMEPRRVEAPCREDDEQHQRRKLDRHQHQIDARALVRADDQQRGDDQRNADCGHVKPAARFDPMQELGGNMPMRRQHEFADMGRPAHRDCRGSDRVFEDQAPADDPGQQFAEDGVGIGIGAAGCRHHRRHLGVAKRRAAAQDAAEKKRQQHARPGQSGADPGQRIDSRPDDGADAHRHQMRPAQRRLQPLVGILFGDRVDRFAACDETHAVPLLMRGR